MRRRFELTRDKPRKMGDSGHPRFRPARRHRLAAAWAFPLHTRVPRPDANLAAVSHLRPVPDPRPPSKEAARGEHTPTVAELERWATVLRIDCVRMLAVAKSGHLDSSLSAADIVAALYYRVLRHDPENPDWPERDRFVLCKGHAAPIQYAALAHHGYFPLEDLMGLRKIGAQLQGHPDMNRTAGRRGLDRLARPGPLDVRRDLPRAAPRRARRHARTSSACSPTATARRARPGRRRPPRRTSGSRNLTAIVDYNHLQTDGTTEEVMDIGDVRAKFEAFGWDTVEIDGHDMGAIVEALERSRTLDRPAAIVAQTKKGRGVSSMEGRFGFHGKPPTPEQAEEALDELRRGSRSRPRRSSGRGRRGLMAAKTEPIATRHAYGDALVELGEAHEDVVALDADLSVSTQSAKFGKQVPGALLQRRRRRGEHDVDGLRAGRDRQGPYCSTFAIFATGRAYDQVRLGIAHNELKVRIGASHGGVSLGEDGASHQMIEDIALMRAMPRMTGRRPGRLQPGLPRDARVLRARGADVHALRPARRRRSSTRRSPRPSATASTSCARARTSR